jgi:hypothetical protein
LKPREIRVVHGHGGGQVQAAFLSQPIGWFHQAVQKGTGHAVQQALPKIPPGDVALILYGDVPLVQPATLKKLVAKAAKGQVAVLTANINPRDMAASCGERGPSWRSSRTRMQRPSSGRFARSTPVRRASLRSGSPVEAEQCPEGVLITDVIGLR